MTGTRPPNENLQPGSWTEAEANALEGRRVKFRTGQLGTLKAAAGMVNGDTVFAYAVQIEPDGGKLITLTKGDAERGEWAFDLLPS